MSAFHQTPRESEANRAHRLRMLEITMRLYWRVRKGDAVTASLASVLRKAAIEDAKSAGITPSEIEKADERGRYL